MLKPIVSTNGSNRSGHKIFMQVDGKRVEERVCEGERDRTAQAILCVCNVCAYVCSTELQTGKVRGELPIQSL